MSYATIQPPFTLQFREMSKKELTSYFEWFQGILPQRLEQLINAVKETPGFADWKADFSPASLDLLGRWFAMQVETRPRTLDEVQEIESRSAYPVEVPDEDLTNRTFSIAMDVGMYLSHVFLTNHPGLRWEQTFGNKKAIDYGQPVLTGFGVAEFNPVHMMVTLAYGVASRKKNGSRLRELYDIWSKMIKVSA